MRVERRLTTPRYLYVVVPAVSVVVAFLLGAIVLGVTGHDAIATYRRIIDAAFVREGALTGTITSATPLLFTGLAAAAAFRMKLWNIGGEGQLYFGAIGAAGIAIALHGADPAVLILGMILGGAVAGAAWAAIPGVLRAYFSTNEIITSLMLNYVAAMFATYLIFDVKSYWRDTSSATAALFPVAKTLEHAATWPHFPVDLGIGLSIPLGFLLGTILAVVLFGVYRWTRFGFEMLVIGDSPRAARYAGMHTRRKIVTVMMLSGGIAGLAGASQIGDFRHQLDPKGLQSAGFGYSGIVVAALARFNPLAVVVVSVLIGGLRYAGFALQGPDFPSGLVGMLQGLILFSALGGEILVRYRIRLGASR
jgi:simple sugar transport system permease protein